MRVSESFASKCANNPAFYVLAILELVFVRQSARGESRDFYPSCWANFGPSLARVSANVIENAALDGACIFSLGDTVQ